jgi:TonB-linked SusC/RagA family outer membrane protein
MSSARRSAPRRPAPRRPAGALPARPARPTGGAPRLLAAGLAAALVAALPAMLVPGAAAAQPPAAPARQGSVAGAVVDATGRPLEGVQVAATSAGARGAIGAMTGADGRFRLAGLPTSGQVTLTVRRVGYRSLTETVAVGRTDVRLTLTEAARVLDQMVVTGTAQATERRAIGNSITSVDAATVQQVAPASSAASLINGRAPGVVMVQGSGAVGSGPRFRIRGSSSLSLSDQPLVYIDGVRMASDVSTGPQTQFFGSAVVSRLNDLNPDDIESVEIVKGPAAATLYGTEANNGVIQIITKRGRAGRSSLGVDVRQGSNWFNDAQERIGYNYSKNAVTGAIDRWSAVEQEEARGTPLFRTGRNQQYNLALSGGSPAARYYLSSGYQNDQGVEPTNFLWRYAGRANLSITATPTFDLTASVGLTQQNIHLPLEAGGGMWFSAYFGQAPRTAADSLRRGFFSAPPEAFWNAFENYQRTSRTISSLTLNHRVGEWFSQRLTTGYDQTGEDNVGLTRRMGPELRQFFGNPVDQNGGKQSRRRELGVASVDYAGTAKATLPFGIASSTSGGAQFFRRNTYALLARGEGFPTSGLTQVDAAATTFGGEALVTNSTLGFYAQEQLSIADRLYLTAALRVDDNSAFGSNFSWVKYPKLSAAWVASEESWWPTAAVSQFKLRAAYGETGQQPATFSALRTYGAITTGSGISGVTPNSIGNADLKPERGKEFESGFDASLLGDRLGLEFNVYRRTTDDAILAATVAPSSGFAGTRFTNIGELRTQGVELQARGTLLRRTNFGLDATLNVSRNGSEIRDLGGPEFIGTGNIRQQVGYPVGSYWDYRIVSAEFNANGTTRNPQCDDGKGGTTPCLNASGAVIAPRVFYGRTDPANEGSFALNGTLFRNLRLYGMVDWKTGHTQFNNNVRARCQVFRLCPENLEPLKYDPVLVAQYDSPNILRNFAYGDASFARLRELSAAYALPGALARAARANSATVTLSARNLKLWTNWTGVDPESFFTFEQFARLEQAQVPPLRQVLVSMNLTF